MGNFKGQKAARMLLLVCAMLSLELTAFQELLSGLEFHASASIAFDRPVR